MNRTLLSLCAATALLPGAALAQDQTSNECERLVLFLNDHPNVTAVTQEKARDLQTKNDQSGCRAAYKQAQAGTTDTQQTAQSKQNGADITVTQPAPNVTVDQQAPEVTVQQPEASVTVRQQQPEIIVNQPAPTITVDIPQPEIIVRMPKPDVNVSQAAPKVAVQQVQPQVRVEQQKQAQVKIEKSESPQVKLTQPDSNANVQFEQTGQPKITYNEAEPQVKINRAPGEPKLRVEQVDRQASAEQQSQAGEITGSIRPSDQTQRMSASDVKGKEIMNAQGEQVGKAKGLVKGVADNKLYVLVDQNGFLGQSGKQIAMSVDGLILDDGKIVVPDLSNEQIQAFPAFKPSAQFPMATASTIAEFRTAAK